MPAVFVTANQDANRPRESLSRCGHLVSIRPLDVDRKSTRLNSSHLVISYAVFSLKKKNHPFLFFSTSQYQLNSALHAIDVFSTQCTLHGWQIPPCPPAAAILASPNPDLPYA